MRTCFALTLSLIGNIALAQNVSRLYPREKLEADAARFGEQIRAEYRETIVPQLTESERNALGTVKIDIPVSGPNGDPFEFYTDGGTIYLPALRSRAQHCGDTRHHNIDIHTRASRNFLERLTHEPLDLVLRNREDFLVNRIVMLGRQHGSNVVGGTRAVVRQYLERRHADAPKLSVER